MFENGYTTVENKNILQSPLRLIRMNLKRSNLGRCLVIPAMDANVQRAFSVPRFVTSPHGIPATESNIQFSTASQVNTDSDSNKEYWSESS